MPSFTAVTLATHPPTLSESESALLTEAIGNFGLRGNQMTRDTEGRLYAAPVGPDHYLVASDAVSKYKSVADIVHPSYDPTHFLAWKAKRPVQEFTVGTYDPTSIVFAYPERAAFWGADYLDADQVAVIFSDKENTDWLILCRRTDAGWVETDNAKLRSATSLAAHGEFIVIGNNSGKKLQVYGVRENRLHKLGTVDCSATSGTPMRLAHEGEWALFAASPYDSKAHRLDGLDDLWKKAKTVNAKKDTHVLESLCGGIQIASYDDELEATQKAAYETFAAQDETVERFVGTTSKGFVAQWPKDVLRHVRVDGAGGFETGPKLVTPGKRFESWVPWTSRFGDVDILEMSGGFFVIP